MLHIVVLVSSHLCGGDGCSAKFRIILPISHNLFSACLPAYLPQLRSTLSALKGDVMAAVDLLLGFQEADAADRAAETHFDEELARRLHLEEQDPSQGEADDADRTAETHFDEELARRLHLEEKEGGAGGASSVPADRAAEMQSDEELARRLHQEEGAGASFPETHLDEELARRLHQEEQHTPSQEEGEGEGASFPEQMIPGVGRQVLSAREVTAVLDGGRKGVAPLWGGGAAKVGGSSGGSGRESSDDG